MTERTMLIDGPNPGTATLDEWQAYALELEGLIAGGYRHLEEELKDARAWIDKHRLQSAKRPAA